MATQLPDPSPAFELAAHFELDPRPGLVVHVACALAAACLVACGTPVEEPPPGKGDRGATEAGREDSSNTPSSSTEPSSTTKADSMATSEAEWTKPASSASASPEPPQGTNTVSTSDEVTGPPDTSNNVDRPAPTPDVLDPEGSAIPPGSGPLGVETTCDGVDDDKNGVVDDVDATSDGVCDCLEVATLGLHGEWGEGNFVTGWLADHVQSAATDLDGQPLTAELLEPFHVLLIRDVSRNHNATLSFSAEEVNELWTWVRNGGGLMTVIGYSDPDESANVNTLLEPFGLSYGSDQIVQGMGASVPVSEWLEHPLSSGITQVGADNGYPVVGQGVTFAKQDDFEIGKALTVGDGHVLVWGDEWITYEAEWASDTTYQVDRFWRNALLWLSRATRCRVNAK